jgi:hypothetical protein
MQADFVLLNHQSVYSLRPCTEAARQWVLRNEGNRCTFIDGVTGVRMRA